MLWLNGVEIARDRLNVRPKVSCSFKTQYVSFGGNAVKSNLFSPNVTYCVLKEKDRSPYVREHSPYVRELYPVLSKRSMSHWEGTQ